MNTQRKGARISMYNWGFLNLLPKLRYSEYRNEEIWVKRRCD